MNETGLHCLRFRVNGPPEVDTIWLWVYYKKIPIHPTPYSIYLRGLITWGVIKLLELSCQSEEPGNARFRV